MIFCRKIKKSFGNVNIFNNFSYAFDDKGIYVLYGVSGSGKTTLLHMLLGITDFDDGEIIFNDCVYKKQVLYSQVQNRVAYICQDAYFIDYLTMEENLLLQSKKSKHDIFKIVNRFKLDKCLKKFPAQLSGGEKQRFALIGNILQDKKIFFLDEPTSSLDKKNRDILYDLLNQLKDECLIICSSHDSSIFNLSCEVIDFNNLDNYCNNVKVKEVFKYQSPKSKSFFKDIITVFFNLCKQIIRREKKLVLLYTFIFTLVILLLFVCTDYNDKVINSLINNYNLKSTQVLCSLNSGDYCEKIFSSYSVDEFVYNYIRNIPVFDEEEGSSSFDETDFEMNILSLPFSKSNIDNIDNKLLYGSYYSNKNEVILGFEKAIELSSELNISLKELIGKNIRLKLPDGIDQFEVVGIFKHLDMNNEPLLVASLGGELYDHYYYLNGKYLEKYLYDDVLGMDEKNDYRATSLTVYFSSVKEFIKFYNDYIDKNLTNSMIQLKNPVDNFANYYTNNELMKIISFATSVSFLALGLIFYYQIHKTRLGYTEHNYSIYEYYGYSEKCVKIATIFYFILYILFVILFSLIIASVISIFVNKAVIDKNLLPYPLFVISIEWIFILLIVVISIALLEGFRLNYTRKKKGWFYLIKEKSDLL